METFLEALYNYIHIHDNAHCNDKKYILMLISEALIMVF
jgi:chromatin remodeling complex protein RSC6